MMEKIFYKIQKKNGRLVLPLMKAAEYFSELSYIGRKQIVSIIRVRK